MQIIDANWIKGRLTGRRGEKAELARALGLPSSAFAAIMAGKRRVQPHEMPVVFKFFAEQGSPEDVALQLQEAIDKLTPDERRYILASVKGVLAERRGEDSSEL